MKIAYQNLIYSFRTIKVDNLFKISILLYIIWQCLVTLVSYEEAIWSKHNLGRIYALKQICPSWTNLDDFRLWSFSLKVIHSNFASVSLKKKCVYREKSHKFYINYYKCYRYNELTVVVLHVMIWKSRVSFNFMYN